MGQSLAERRIQDCLRRLATFGANREIALRFRIFIVRRGFCEVNRQDYQWGRCRRMRLEILLVGLLFCRAVRCQRQVGHFLVDVGSVMPTADENRPKSAVVMYCIKATDEYMDPEQVDISEVANALVNKADREEVRELAGTGLWRV